MTENDRTRVQGQDDVADIPAGYGCPQCDGASRVVRLGNEDWHVCDVHATCWLWSGNEVWNNGAVDERTTMAGLDTLQGYTAGHGHDNALRQWRATVYRWRHRGWACSVFELPDLGEPVLVAWPTQDVMVAVRTAAAGVWSFAALRRNPDNPEGRWLGSYGEFPFGGAFEWHKLAQDGHGRFD